MLAGSPFDLAFQEIQAMREQLIRYLLGELDLDERRELQSRLKSSPELRAELEQLRSCFAASQEGDLFAPDAPSGLAARTAGRVAGGEDASDSRVTIPTTRLSHASDPPAGILGWSLADLTVAFGVMLAVSMLIFPALRNSRDGTRRNQCGNQLREMGMAFARYAQDHGWYLPQVGPNENAGVFTAKLIGNRYAQPEEMSVWLVCPGSPLADRFRSHELELRLPNAEQIHGMSHPQLMRVTAVSSPFYNYCFPYRVGKEYRDIQHRPASLSPVIADTSGDDEGHPMSLNHGGRIVQVLCADGNLRSLTSVTLPGSDDDMYLNNGGKAKAGFGPLDSVLGPSDAFPADEIPVDGE
jgi:hypothetical protein